MLPEFKNKLLLDTALTHRSALNEKTSKITVSNERLEFLGDAVLELSTTRFLFEKFPDEPEGVLTAYRSSLVKTTTLATIATKLGLDKMLYMSKGEEATGGRSNIGILADVTEAVLGALYLDQGLDSVDKLLEEILFPEISTIIENKLYKDAKSYLQEVVQAKNLETPTYQVISEVGPDHDKEFTVNASIDNKIVGRGTGKSKQQAQQAAAIEALKKFNAS
ncbi:ribonuclease III [Candidatus Woesebacteria bacterium]|nr:ribonuclease III [Candidatus Woesebacteria bacterium]